VEESRGFLQSIRKKAEAESSCGYVGVCNERGGDVSVFTRLIAYLGAGDDVAKCELREVGL
jgi:hypothetical protein